MAGRPCCNTASYGGNKSGPGGGTPGPLGLGWIPVGVAGALIMPQLTNQFRMRADFVGRGLRPIGPAPRYRVMQCAGPADPTPGQTKQAPCPDFYSKPRVRVVPYPAGLGAFAEQAVNLRQEAQANRFPTSE